VKRIGILTSGGDCPGLNAVIASAVKAGSAFDFEFVGFERGWEGILSPMMFRALTPHDVRGISHTGGTILRTTNKGRFGAKAGQGDGRRIPEDVLLEARHNLEYAGIDALIVIGGDGSLSGAMQLAEYGVKIVGVPKTIDNDLSCTDRTFGYSTACQVVVDALDRIHTTATSHSRVIFVETMGRHAGWIAMRAGLAGGADAILLPEFPYRAEAFVDFLKERADRCGSSVIVVAEGSRIEDVGGHRERAGQEVLLGGVSNKLMSVVERLAPDVFDMRGTVLGHVQRGGTPNCADRMLAKAYGVAAANAVNDGAFGRMVCYNSLGMSTVPIEAAVGRLKTVTTDTVDYRTAVQLGVFIH
jgi:ATP-dependent phosphofructokinase / diphosphate-dependent phosphofructokinase